MSTIRNANTTGGGMYAPSTGINTALTNPNGVTGAHQSNGAGFSGNAEHFTFGDPFKPVPQGYTPYNPALGPSQQPLPTAPVPTAPSSAAPAVPGGGIQAPVLQPAPGATDVFGTTEIGPGVTGGPLGPGPSQQLPADPNEAYMVMCGMGVPPAEAAKAAISGQTPTGGGGFRQSGGEGPYALGNPPPGFNQQMPQRGGPIEGSLGTTLNGGPTPGWQTGGGPPPGWNGQTGFGQIDAAGIWGRGNGAMSSPGAHAGPIQGEAVGGTISGGPPPGFYDRPPQRGGQYDTTGRFGRPSTSFGDNFFGGGFGGGGQYGYGQGSNVSMLQALMGGGGGGYGDFLSRLLSGNSGR